MEWTFTVPNSTGPPVWIEKSFWLDRLRLTRAGHRLPRPKEKGKPFLIEWPGEPNRRILVKRRSLDYLPRVLIDGQEIVLGRPLAIWEYVVGGLPLVLLVVGGGLGGFFGALGAYLNYRLFRRLETGLGKCLSVLGITVGALLAYVIVVAVLRGLLRR